MSNCVSSWNAWNAWNALCEKGVQVPERFRTLCCNVSIEVSQWKHLLLSCFLSHLSLLVKDQRDQKGVVSNAFLGFENWSESGISEQFKRSEMPVSMMVSKWFFGHWQQKTCFYVALIKYFIERWFYSIVTLFSFREWHWKSLILEDERLLIKVVQAFRLHSDRFNNRTM